MRRIFEINQNHLIADAALRYVQIYSWLKPLKLTSDPQEIEAAIFSQISKRDKVASNRRVSNYRSIVNEYLALLLYASNNTHHHQ